MRKHWQQNSPCTYFHNVTEAGTGAHRRVKEEKPRYVPSDWDDSLPYGGKVYLARRKLPDSWFCILIQVRNGEGGATVTTVITIKSHHYKCMQWLNNTNSCTMQQYILELTVTFDLSNCLLLLLEHYNVNLIPIISRGGTVYVLRRIESQCYNFLMQL